ncbi:hypothetical protein QAD02_023921 [Eretmocerus hayati]|uniref:Uncharacterized protein n=1 Tax=Eretmocerus hayati TaxID=131215 RepID=A0ACC2PYW2_9HYME|nr:hypothetical protein QAD02_023921 [Eretmocerus hayati]
MESRHPMKLRSGKVSRPNKDSKHPVDNKRESSKLKDRQLLEAVCRSSPSIECDAREKVRVLAKIRRLLRAGADPNYTIKDNKIDDDYLGRYSCLHYVVFFWSEDAEMTKKIIDLLLSAGADPNIVDHDQAGADVKAADSDGWTSLHYACQHGDIKTVKLLIENGAQIDVVDKDGFSLLFPAVRSENVEVVRLLIDAGLDVNKNDFDDDELQCLNHTTPLHAAVERGNVEIVKLLLERGADPKAVDIYGNCPLSSGIILKCKNCYPLLKLMLSHGLDMYYSDRSCNAPSSLFAKLVWNNKVAETRFLLEQGLDLSRYIPRAPKDFSPLHVAIEKSSNSGEMLSLLLEYGSKGLLDIEYENEDLESPLFVAASKGYFQCIKALIEFGADVNHGNCYNSSPLNAAAMSGLENINSNSSENDWESDQESSSETNSFTVEPDPKDYTQCIRLLVEAGAKIGNILSRLIPPHMVDIVDANADDSIRDYTYQREKVELHLDTAKCIVKYRALYENRTPSVAEPIENGNMSKSVKVQTFYKSCKSEIALLQDSPLHSTITYYDMLVADDDFHKRIRDDRVYEAFDREHVIDCFSIYSVDLLERFQEVDATHKIWEKSVSQMSQFLELDADSYYLVLQNILSRLSDNDLIALIASQ